MTESSESNPIQVSFVIPLYHSAGTIREVVKEIEALNGGRSLEIVLVNDGSKDNTADVCRGLLAETKVPIIYVEHTRNFGEHNAVLTGWRHARGKYVVNLDDDGQNPPSEAWKLYEETARSGLDAVYGHYVRKEHAGWRNAGSWFTNRVTDWLLDKPAGFYLSSFRCVRAWVAREVAANEGPFPYIDGLILQVTQKIGSMSVDHRPREGGDSSYTLGKLLRLWLSTVVNFSVVPLRLATILGLVIAASGLVGLGLVIYWRMTNQGPPFGWGSSMAALLVFSGVQLVMLGLIGEYVGRMFITVNRRPQSIVRSVQSSATS